MVRYSGSWILCLLFYTYGTRAAQSYLTFAPGDAQHNNNEACRGRHDGHKRIYEQRWGNLSCTVSATDCSSAGSLVRVPDNDRAYQYLMAYQAEQQRVRDNTLRAGGFDEIWLSEAARDVKRRCRVINYDNEDIRLQKKAPSPLPPHFQDSFEIQDSWPTRFLQKCWYDDDSFQALLAREAGCEQHELSLASVSEEVKARMRAIMRNWHRYESEQFCLLIEALPVYETYICEIGAQLKHDQEFAQRLKRMLSARAVERIESEYVRMQGARRDRELCKKLQEERAERLAEQKQKAADQQERKRKALATRAAQQDALATAAERWRTTHSARYSAFQAVQQHPGQATQQHYYLSTIAQSALQKHDALSPLLTHNELVLTGNGLQHELLSEIVTHVERWAHVDLSLATVPLQAALHRDSMLFLEHAHSTNKLGDCATGAQLIDIGATLIDYCQALGQGVMHGIIDGTIGTAISLVEAVCHPLDAAEQMGITITKVAQFISNYLPPCLIESDEGATAVSWEAFHVECDRVAHTWQEAFHQCKHLFEHVPSPADVEQAAYLLTTIPTHLLTAHAASKLVATLAQYAKGPRVVAGAHTAEMVHSTKLAQYVMKKAEQIARPVQKNYHALELQYNDLIKRYVPQKPFYLAMHMPLEHITCSGSPCSISASPISCSINSTELSSSHAQQILCAPQQFCRDYFEISLQKTKKHIAQKMSSLGCSNEVIHKTIAYIQHSEIEGCLKTFNYAMSEFKDVQGFSSVMDSFCKNISNGGLQRISGTYYELHSAVKLHKNGTRIIEFSRKVPKIGAAKNKYVEYDIITTAHVIECKSMHFKNLLKNIPNSKICLDKIARLTEQCKHGVTYAQSQGLSYCVLFNESIPLELEWLREKLTHIGARVIDSFH